MDCHKAESIYYGNSRPLDIDIGSKAEIYEQIHNFAKEGMAIILISDEIQEIMANCNRVLVLANGKAVKWMEEEEPGAGGC